jgi:hypothetical protein
MANIYGEVDTLDILQERRDFDWTGIHIRYPNQNPLALLLSQLAKEKATNPEYNHFEDELLADVVVVNGTQTTAATILLDDATSLVAGEVLHNPRTGKNIRIQSVDGSANTVTFAAATGETWNDNDELFNIGPTHAEGSTVADPVCTKVEKKYNYCQIFKKTISLTNTLKASEMRGASEEKHLTTMAEKQFDRAMEYAFLFGERSESTLSGKPIRQTGGILEWITTNVTNVGGTTLDESVFDGWLKDVFENGDTDNRLVLASPTLMQAITGFSKQKLQTAMGQDTYGLNITKYLSPFGSVNLVMHRLLKGNVYGSYGICLDLNNLKYKHLRDVMLRRNIQAEKDDETMHEIIAEVGLKLINEQSHGVIRNFTA